MSETPSQEETMEQLQKLLQERGKEALELARKTVLEEKIESKEVREALEYFMTEYWHDVARPALLSLACEAVGGDPNITTPIAIPLSLISGAIDIHDDIIDQSEVKNLRPTVFGKFGKDIALLAGDALMFKGFTLLHEAVKKGITAEKISIICDIIKKTFFELGDAEALELHFRGRMDITPKQYLRVVKKKAADVEAHTHISAILGNGTPEQVESLSVYGRLLGMLIILRDDLIDLADPEETIHRIKKEHLSLPIICALQKPVAYSTIYPIYMKKEIAEKDFETIVTTVVNAKGPDIVDEIMQELVKDATKKVKKVKKNQHYLLLLVHGMLLPKWQSYLNPTKI